MKVLRGILAKAVLRRGRFEPDWSFARNATTSPTMIKLGDLKPLAVTIFAMVASVPTSTRWCGVVPFSMMAVGMDGVCPWAINWRLISDSAPNPM